MPAIVAVLEGTDRVPAARRGGMDLQALGDWVLRYGEHGIDGLHDQPPTGRKRRLDDAQLARLKAMVVQGPAIEQDGIRHWIAKDPCRLVERDFGVSYSERGMSGILRELGLAWQKT